MPENLSGWIVRRSGWAHRTSSERHLIGAPDEKLKAILTDFINILLNGELPLSVREILFWLGLSHSRKRRRHQTQRSRIHLEATSSKMRELVCHQEEKRRIIANFIPFALETGCFWNAEAIELTNDIGKGIAAINSEPLQTIPVSTDFYRSSERQFLGVSERIPK